MIRIRERASTKKRACAGWKIVVDRFFCLMLPGNRVYEIVDVANEGKRARMSASLALLVGCWRKFLPFCTKTVTKTEVREKSIDANEIFGNRGWAFFSAAIKWQSLIWASEIVEKNFDDTIILEFY